MRIEVRADRRRWRCSYASIAAVGVGCLERHAAVEPRFALGSASARLALDHAQRAVGRIALEAEQVLPRLGLPAARRLPAPRPGRRPRRCCRPDSGIASGRWRRSSRIERVMRRGGTCARPAPARCAARSGPGTRSATRCAARARARRSRRRPARGSCCAAGAAASRRRARRTGARRVALQRLFLRGLARGGRRASTAARAWRLARRGWPRRLRRLGAAGAFFSRLARSASIRSITCAPPPSGASAIVISWPSTFFCTAASMRSRDLVGVRAGSNFSDACCSISCCASFSSAGLTSVFGISMSLIERTSPA